MTDIQNFFRTEMNRLGYKQFSDLFRWAPPLYVLPFYRFPFVCPVVFVAIQLLYSISYIMFRTTVVRLFVF